MSLFSSPVPQWQDMGNIVAAAAMRLNPVLDASGFWVLPQGVYPSGAFKDDPSGFGIIDDTTTVGLRVAQIPSGFVVTY